MSRLHAARPGTALPERPVLHHVPADARDDETARRRRSPRLQEILELIETVAVTHGTGVTIHDRHSERFEFEGPIVVQPLDAEGRPDGEPLFVEGRDLSVGGLSFRHERPLHHRHVAVSFPFVETGGRCVVAELGWCRFTREGVYRSGGRFVRTLTNDVLGSVSPAS